MHNYAKMKRGEEERKGGKKEGRKEVKGGEEKEEE